MKPLRMFSLTICVMAAAALHLGCETESASDNSLRIVPAAASLRINESREFTASGGYDYSWRLARPELGTLTTRVGPTTVYISRTAPPVGTTAIVQTLILTSTPQPDAVGATNAGEFVRSAEAVIEHLGAPPAVTTTTTPVTPTTTTPAATTTTAPVATTTTGPFPPLPI